MPVNFKIPVEAQPAFIAFEADFLKSYLSKPKMWLTEDLIRTVNAGPEMVVARWPIPLNQAGYRRHQGEIKYRELSQAWLETTYDEWSDGVHERLDTLMAIAQWTGWADQPRLMADAAWILEQKVVAADIEANSIGWDLVPFFSAVHPVNFITGQNGVQSNILTGMTPSVSNIARVRDVFRHMKGPDGQFLGLELQGFLSPVDLTSPLEDLLLPLTVGVVMAVVNGDDDPYRWRGKYWLREVPEFTNQNYYYAVATNTGQKPFVGMRKMAPASINMTTGQVTMSGSDIETFIHDMNSKSYEDTGMVGVGKKKKYGARTAIHTAIIRCEI